MPDVRYALLIVINLWSVEATKYCSYELNGDPKYFVCARNEYCCNLGCCVHLAFQFYQLWYYWLLLIFMFMICSGGSWWYKFCRQNETASHYPSVPLTIERAGRHNFPDLHGRRVAARAFDRSHANEPSSYHFHRIWKANNIGSSPNYYTTPIVRYHNGDVDSRRRNQNHECPYYQLYGPPPSYESVVQISESSHNGQASCMLLSGTNAVSLPPQMITATSQGSSSVPTQPVDPAVTSTVITMAASSSLVTSTTSKQPAETAPVLSDTSADSSPTKSLAASPTAAPHQSTADATRHSLHSPSSKPSTSDLSQHHHHIDQSSKGLQYSFHHPKNYRQTHHLLHHPTIHNTGGVVNVQDAGVNSPSCQQSSRLPSRNTSKSATATATASSPTSTSVSSSTETHHQPSVDGTATAAQVSLSLTTLSSSASPLSQAHSVIAATKLTLSSPIDENGTRV